MCQNLEPIFFRVSSLAYPNLLGKKDYVVVVVLVVYEVVFNDFFEQVISTIMKNTSLLQQYKGHAHWPGRHYIAN